MEKKTIILGATPNQARYAYFAASMLQDAGIEFVPIGRKAGEVFGKQILNIDEKPQVLGVHTVTLYIGSDNLVLFFEYILSLVPKRIIFNPGTENQELARLAKEQGIEVEFACTLTMITVGLY